jgi:hypothetical protein
MRIPFALLQVQKWQHPVSAGLNPGQQGQHHVAEGQHHALHMLPSFQRLQCFSPTVQHPVQQ